MCSKFFFLTEANEQKCLDTIFIDSSNLVIRCNLIFLKDVNGVAELALVCREPGGWWTKYETIANIQARNAGGPD